jgi:hypothetical protein
LVVCSAQWDVLPPSQPVALPWTREEVRMVIRYTRNWIHYGFLSHTVLCILIAAVKGVLGS